MTDTHATTATTLEGQILELAQKLKERYSAPDRNAGERITIDADLEDKSLTLKILLDATVVNVGEKIELIASDIQLTGISGGD